VQVADNLDAGRRITISDIARLAGVSKGAVSLALNDRPGLSTETRERILKIVDELGWSPSRAARALSASKAGACGLVLARPPRMLALEPFFIELISGVESELSERSIAITIQLVHDQDEEIEVYRRWWAERRVDGVLMANPKKEDARVAELRRLGMPAVVVGGPLDGHALPCAWYDEVPAIYEMVGHLAALGHKRIARVSGPGELIHSTARTAAFVRVAGEMGIAAEVAESDFAPEGGARATRELLSSPSPPTAIAFDSDLLAVTGLGVAQQMGAAVPDDVSLVAWDDSLMCSIVHPPLTAVTRDIPGYGTAVARLLLATIDGRSPSDVEIPRGQLTARGSTGPAKAAVPVVR
jgi:DNA-binding LacI/PurR family transcriptional regulator